MLMWLKIYHEHRFVQGASHIRRRRPNNLLHTYSYSLEAAENIWQMENIDYYPYWNICLRLNIIYILIIHMKNWKLLNNFITYAKHIFDLVCCCPLRHPRIPPCMHNRMSQVYWRNSHFYRSRLRMRRNLLLNHIY